MNKLLRLAALLCLVQIVQINAWNAKETECDSTELCESTVHEDVNFNAEKEANSLLEAMKHENDYEIAKIITLRPLKQRMAIIEECNKRSKEANLIMELDDNLSDDINFKHVILALMRPLEQYYAGELHEALTGYTINDKTIIDILGSLSNAGIKAVVRSFREVGRISLEENLRTQTCSKLGLNEMYGSLAKPSRNEDKRIDETAIKKDVHDLTSAAGKNKSVVYTLSSILISRSREHLRQVFAKYEKESKRKIEDLLEEGIKISLKEDEGENILRYVLTTLVKVAKDRIDFFAENIYNSLTATNNMNEKNKPIIRGIEDGTLIITLTSRSEIDMGNIKKAFQKKYNISLAKMIQKNVPGIFGGALLGLIGEFNLVSIPPQKSERENSAESLANSVEDLSLRH